jgi:nucleotide-binding universal stress UspA family protein
MSYKSILVNLDIDAPIGPLVQGAADLATRFDGELIGFCAADAPFPMIMTPESGDIAVGWWRQQREDIESRFKEMRAEFDRVVAGSVRTEWRATVGDPTHTLVATSKVADLIVTAAPTETAIGNAYRTVDLGSLVLQSGRPLLVLADKSRKIATRKIVIAWKDTREARRAVADAVPLLAVANEVIVVTVASDPDKWDRDSVADVCTFLANHGIKARTEVIKAVDEAGMLIEFATSSHADLIVSGAYGHSRLREWAFGGVTRSLLDETGLNHFMSS